ncbi:histidine kinase [Mycolicibacterium moriokaense]|nr:histidine kinase [Mycolicibacterium moriokaense]
MPHGQPAPVIPCHRRHGPYHEMGHTAHYCQEVRMGRLATVSEQPLDPSLLRTLFLFEALPDEDLESIAAKGTLVDCQPGLVFGEGEPACYFYVLVDGEVSLSKRTGDRDVETIRTSHRGAYCGATASYIDDPPEEYGFSGRAIERTRLVRIDARFLGEFIRTSYPMAVHLLQGMHVDHEGVHQVVDQQRLIRAAGTLTAGLMHGLNNPVAAISRIADQLSTLHDSDRQIATYRGLSPSTAAAYQDLRSTVSTLVRSSQRAPLAALERIRREEEIDDWLTSRGIERPWEKAPTLAAGGVAVDWLHAIADTAAGFDEDGLEALITAVVDQIEGILLVRELADASREVSALVASARQYSQVDSAPVSPCDVNDSLDSTLTALSLDLHGSIEIRRDYSPDLPQLFCYAAELNQAWTNMVRNAIDAVRATAAGNGTISLRTALIDGNVIRVDICDTGLGVNSAIRDRIFLPFFTTKPVGQGVGMGLDLAWRTIVGLHHGTLTVTSRPGDTRFTACLPVDPERPACLGRGTYDAHG